MTRSTTTRTGQSAGRPANGAARAARSGAAPRGTGPKPPNPHVAALGRIRNPLARFVKVLGPGFVTGASDDDPSGIATYATVGASAGYGMLWTAPATFPLMATVQYVCAKIAQVSGRGLAGVIRAHYPRWLLYPVVLALLVANTINVGADLGAIAAAISLLVPGLPTPGLVLPVALGILALQVFASYRFIERVFKWLCLALFAYVAAALLARPDWGEVLAGTFLPSTAADRNTLLLLVAILGTTISPYLFFWQTNHEVENQIGMGRTRLWQRQGATDRELRYAALDVNAGMAFSNAVMYFIILTSAATLHANGVTEIHSAADAADALRPFAGDLSTVLFSLGIIGGGMLAIPILSASAAYAISEAFGWKVGLARDLVHAKQFYAVIILATLVGAGMPLVGIDPIDALVVAAVVNGLVAPPLLILIMVVSNDTRIMGSRTNGRLTNVLGWTTAAVMLLAAVALVVTTVAG